MSKINRIIQVEERVPLKMGIPLGFQHTFAMFSASVLVPYILGISPAIALLMNGIGTLIFIFVTKGKSPAYLGSSFAFISPALLVINDPSLGYRYALGGFVVTGCIFMIVAVIIKFAGVHWIDVVLPPAAMGPVVALIGLELAGNAAQNGGIVLTENYTKIDPKLALVFVITLAIAIFGQVLFRGFASAIAILISIVAGYCVALAVGIVDFTNLESQAWLQMPNFLAPKFSAQAIAIIIPASLVVISEHIGHQVVTSEIIERNLLEDPGLHKTLFCDGISTTLSGFCGSVPTTTYGENIGVMAITKVYSVWVIGGAAVISILLSFIGKASGLIQTIPAPVMGGVSFLLYGMIGASGIRLIVDKKVDYSRPRNLALTSVIFITGLSGAYIQLGSAKLTGMSLATVVGIVLGILFYLLDKFKLTNDIDDVEAAEAAEMAETAAEK